jgi:hypothetical protein
MVREMKKLPLHQRRAAVRAMADSIEAFIVKSDKTRHCSRQSSLWCKITVSVRDAQNAIIRFHYDDAVTSSASSAGSMMPTSGDPHALHVKL